MAITQSYVDYGAGNDTTGDGTVGTPWKTLQKAFDTLTRNTTDGNQVNLKAGTAHVNAASLDLTTFIAAGALAAAAPLILRGYTAAANDGGIGEIDCGGATMWAATTYDNVFLVMLDIHNGGDNNLCVLDAGCHVFLCTFHKGASSPSGKYLLTLGGTAQFVYGCRFYDPGAGAARAISLGNASLAYGNYINMGASATGTGLFVGSQGSIANNIVLCGNTAQVGISANTFSMVNGNICYNTAAGTAQGISLLNWGSTGVNNIVVGWSGAGGEGISHANPFMLGYNAFYNNTGAYTGSDQTFIDLTTNDVTLAADPFTDAANGDFSLTAAAKTALAAKGFPLAYLGAHANTVPNLNIGPIQMAAGGGSSIFRRVARLVGG